MNEEKEIGTYYKMVLYMYVNYKMFKLYSKLNLIFIILILYNLMHLKLKCF